MQIRLGGLWYGLSLAYTYLLVTYFHIVRDTAPME